MGGRSIAAALAALALSAPAAHAETRMVDPAGGPYPTITAAVVASGPGDVIDVRPGFYQEQVFVQDDDITIRAAQGAVVSSTAEQVVSLMGARDAISGLYVAGGPSGVRIAGDHATLEDVTVTADGTGIAIDGGKGATMRRVWVRATALAGTALRARNDAPATQAVWLESSVLVGGREGTALDLGTGHVSDTAPDLGGLDLTLRHVTVAGAPTALRTVRAGRGDPVSVAAYDSIVHGAGADAMGGFSTDTTTPDALTFRDAAALDFRLRADAPGIDRGGPLAPGESDRDVGGAPRTSGWAWDWGAYEFVNTSPVASLTASATEVKQGMPIRFDASASRDPDAGGRIVDYVWVFGDGSIEARTTEPTVEHVYEAVGRPFVTVRATDLQGAGTSSEKVAVTVTDGIGPALRISAPREQARLRRLKTVKVRVKVKARKKSKSTKKRTKTETITRRVPNVLRFSGRVADAGGVGRVELSFRRITAARGPAVPATCSFLDTTARRLLTKPCEQPPVLAATLSGDAWSWSTPAKAPMPAGRWELTVRASDRAGNPSTGVLHFTVT
jgi:hypothetical protein